MLMQKRPGRFTPYSRMENWQLTPILSESYNKKGKVRKMKKIIILFGLLLIATISFADTHIPGGDVSGIWTYANSPYIIDGEINIPVDSTLIIEPGIDVIFSEHYKFKIYGRILAEGTANDTIVFTAQDTTTGWHSLRFHDTTTNGQDSSKVIFCKLEYGKATGNYQDRYGGSICCNNSSDILIKNCLIKENTASSAFGCGGGICCFNSSDILLKNCLIANNTAGSGGGMFFSNSSSILEDVIISNNFAFGLECGDSGGGIFCLNSSLILSNVIIKENISNCCGGGICCKSNANMILTNVNISENCAFGIEASMGFNGGGGILCNDSNLILENVTINGNIAYGVGGGIFCVGANPEITNTIISGNVANIKGGGIYCWFSSNPILENVTITENIAGDKGGGISCDDNSTPNFNTENRCNIFLNYAGLGNDLYMSSFINVFADTFTVLQPNEHFAYPPNNFNFDILHSKIEQVNQDLYVSTNGSDANSGLTPEEPLLTISYALAKIIPDSTNPHTIHLANGNYSASQTGEIFPLNCRSYVSLQGESEFFSIVDCEENSHVLYLKDDDNLTIGGVTIQNGYSRYGGGIYCHSSNPLLNNIIINGNTAEYLGGGVYCYHYSEPELKNVTIYENTANIKGGAIYCYESSLSLTNVTISENSADYGGGIYCWFSDINLENCIVWNDVPPEIRLLDSYATVTYSDIQNGWAGVGNIDADPLFVDPQNGDFHLTWANFPIPDSTMSPCIDTGDPSSPLDPDSTRADMGAYYFDQNQQSVEDTPSLPASYSLHQNYPNSFSSSTTILFDLATKLRSVSPGQAKIEIYNIKGQKIKTFSNLQINKSPNQQIIWDGKDENGHPVSSGIYFYRLIVGDKVIDTKKCLLLK
ncbi:MAG: right-handed parallel beta-helix repeat-containing protein [Candidatus Cloacimonetes bacterium]|nr:right-handed parallel beta-helix repeat-containing protein [Candidatus Cloacimonadota bacterium]